MFILLNLVSVFPSAINITQCSWPSDPNCKSLSYVHAATFYFTSVSSYYLFTKDNLSNYTYLKRLLLTQNMTFKKLTKAD